MTFRFVCEGAILRCFKEGSAYAFCSSAVIDGGVDGFPRVLLRVTGDLDGAERLVEGSVASDLKEVLDRKGLCWTPVFQEDGLSGVDVDGLSGEDVDGILGVDVRGVGGVWQGGFEHNVRFVSTETFGRTVVGTR